MNWLILSIVAAILFGVSPLFMKSGIKKTPAYLGATLWTTVMFIVAIIYASRENVTTSLSSLGNLRLLFLALSGISLGGAIIFMFKALKDGESIKVVPILAAKYYVLYLLSQILERSVPSIPRIIVLVVVIVAVVLMASKSKGRGGNSWCWYSLISMGLLVLTRYLYRHHVGKLNTSAKYLCLFLIATIVVWVVTLATGSFKSIRNLSFVDGIFLILSVFILVMAKTCSSQAISYNNYLVLQIILFSSMFATAMFAAVFLKEKITTQYLIGLFIFEVCCFLWLGYIPVLSEML